MTVVNLESLAKCISDWEVSVSYVLTLSCFPFDIFRVNLSQRTENSVFNKKDGIKYKGNPIFLNISFWRISA